MSCGDEQSVLPSSWHFEQPLFCITHTPVHFIAKRGFCGKNGGSRILFVYGYKCKYLEDSMALWQLAKLELTLGPNPFIALGFHWVYSARYEFPLLN